MPTFLRSEALDDWLNPDTIDDKEAKVDRQTTSSENDSPAPHARRVPYDTHANAPLTPAGRLLLVQHCQSRLVAHVAVEAGVARQTVTKWLRSYAEHGRGALEDVPSAPRFQPARTRRMWWTELRVLVLVPHPASAAHATGERLPAVGLFAWAAPSTDVTDCPASARPDLRPRHLERSAVAAQQPARG